MCYKQCEIWKCFKTRCVENHRLMGYPEPSDDELEPQTTHMIKNEPIDVDLDLDPYDAEQSSRVSYDPLGGGEQQNRSAAGKAPRKRKRKEAALRKTYCEKSEDEDFTLTPQKKVKPPKSEVSHTGTVSSASHSLYMKTYRDFMSWRTTRFDPEINEDLLLEYFTEISKTLAASTLTNKLSHLVRTIEDFHQLKIDKYHRLRQFCKDVRARGSAAFSTFD